jgi:hypothetical protein
MNVRVFAIVVIAAALIAATAFAGWETLTPLTAARIDSVVAVDDAGSLYVIGGSDDSAYYDLTERFVSASGWETLAPAPHPITQADAVFYENKIYIPGGFDGAALAAELLIFDLAANSWSTGSAAPAAQYGYTFDRAGDRFYLIGGADNSDMSQANCFEYNPVADGWQEMSPMNHARRYHGSAVVDGKIYVFGGIDDQAPTPAYLASAEVYDPVGDTWNDIGDMPLSFWGGSSGAVDGAPWACHGLQNAEVSAQCWQYNPAGDEWTAAESAGAARFHIGSGAFPLYAVGGLRDSESGFEPVDVVERYGELPVDDDAIDDDTTDDDLVDDDSVDDDQTPDDDFQDDDTAADDDGGGGDDDDNGCGC